MLHGAWAAKSKMPSQAVTAWPNSLTQSLAAITVSALPPKMSHCDHLANWHYGDMKKLASIGFLAILFFTLKGLAWLAVFFLGANSFLKFVQG